MIRLLPITLVVVLASSVFGADARTLYQSGVQHYNLNEYEEALADFKEAYRLKSDPAFLFNIAQCHRQLGQFADAAAFYRSFRRERPDTPNRAEVDRLITEMEVPPRKSAPKSRRPKRQESNRRARRRQ